MLVYASMTNEDDQEKEFHKSKQSWNIPVVGFAVRLCCISEKLGISMVDSPKTEYSREHDV